MLPVQWILCVWIVSMVLIVITLFNMKGFKFLDDGISARKNYLGEVRFLLSVAVLFHHLILCGFFFDNQGWNDPGYGVSAYCGKMAVAIFFMISGFLFGAINKENKSFWIGFYLKRVFRLGPMCFVSSFLCLGLALLLGDTIYGWKVTMTKAILWFDLGIFNIRPDINSLKRELLINAGATWTLRWEWCLYFSLPFLVFIDKNIKKLILFLVCAIIMVNILYVCYFYAMYMSEKLLVIYSICFGMLCRNTSLFDNLRWRLVFFILGAAICDFWVLEKPSLLFASVIFVAACKKSFLLCFLENNGLRRLGNISYSIFHLHGIIWFVMFLLGGRMSIVGWLFIATGCFFVIIVASTLFYYVLERRMYNYGKLLACRV